jgi:hypothetical protein
LFFVLFFFFPPPPLPPPPPPPPPPPARTGTSDSLTLADFPDSSWAPGQLRAVPPEAE